MFVIDKPFPSFSLETYFPDRKETGTLTLEDFSGKWLILFWYPKDFTFVCPTELADMNARLDQFRAEGAEVVGASTDTVYTHKGWLDSEELIKDLRYPMAADHAGRLARELGIYDEEAGIAPRAAFIVDPTGVLRAVDIVSDNIGRSAGELLRKVKALKFVHENPGKVCPASWDVGAATITPSIGIAGRVNEGMK
jgi:alkyl hydroperoxide reductase subunit AhpC